MRGRETRRQHPGRGRRGLPTPGRCSRRVRRRPRRRTRRAFTSPACAAAKAKPADATLDSTAHARWWTNRTTTRGTRSPCPPKSRRSGRTERRRRRRSTRRRFTSPAVPTRRPKSDSELFDSAVHEGDRLQSGRRTLVGEGPTLVRFPVVIRQGANDDVGEAVPIHVPCASPPRRRTRSPSAATLQSRPGTVARPAGEP